MANDLNITMYDFEKMCRTCLSRENLKPLYERCPRSPCIAEMLMTCTFIKFVEDDGLPMKICTNCIYEINQAFSFAKRCEIIDAFLRKCVKIKTELANNSSQSQKVEPIIKAEEEMNIQIKQKIVLPNIHRTVEEVLSDYKCVSEVKREKQVKKELKPKVILPNMYQTVEEVLKDYKYVDKIKQEEDIKIKYEVILPNMYQTVEEVFKDYKYVDKIKQEEDIKIKYECDVHADKEYEVNEKDYLDEDGNEHENKTYSEIFDNHKVFLDSHSKVQCFKQEEYVKIKYEHYETDGHANEEYEVNENDYMDEEDNELENKTYSEISDNHKVFLDSHSKVNKGVQPYNCDVGGKIFKSFRDFIVHKQIHKGEEQICSICSKTFSARKHLKRHMNMHTGVKPYSCEVCDKSFMFHWALANHKVTHTGEKPHVCSICNKGFIVPNKLKHHMSRHTRDKPFFHSCTICSKNFRHKSSFNRHLRVRTREKPYSYEVCGKSFPEKENLANHKRTHNEKQCDRGVPN